MYHRVGGAGVMNSSARLKTALFDVKDGLGWVSSDVFVARRHGGLLKEGWDGIGWSRYLLMQIFGV